MNEHYCRRWISVKTIVESLKQNKVIFLMRKFPVMKIAVMSLVFSSATEDPFKRDCLRSISVGILITPGWRKNLNSLTISQ
jgi:hypothetical protein